ncbi:MAG: 3-deoxy-8-phosphooctulonate synthase [Kiritimatiellaeota bacterium]|nr:3-deoxy-8-phosphooctulonate synthase [Kiritimatiellota bacterium]
MPTTRVIHVGTVRLGGRHPLALIAGPCVIESRAGCLALAARLARLARDEGIPFIFKASYDKANRTALHAFRGPGLSRGLDILREVKERYGLPILTDVHSEAEVPLAAQVADVLQLPAFLCRQTDLVLALGASGRVVNIKKGQFLAPWDVRHVIAKLESTGNRNIIVTERGASFGYNNLVADLRSLPILRAFGYPVIFDATHSVQLPGGAGDRSGGDGRWAPHLARAAAAAGCDGVFVETHVRPAQARSDAANALPFAALRPLWRQLRAIDRIVRCGTSRSLGSSGIASVRVLR